MTITALLIALAAPALCAAGLYRPSEPAEACTDRCCDHEQKQESSQNTDETACPLAGTGVCTGLVFVIADADSPAVTDQVVWLSPELNPGFPRGHSDDLIRPPSRSC